MYVSSIAIKPQGLQWANGFISSCDIEATLFNQYIPSRYVSLTGGPGNTSIVKIRLKLLKLSQFFVCAFLMPTIGSLKLILKICELQNVTPTWKLYCQFGSNKITFIRSLIAGPGVLAVSERTDLFMFGFLTAE